MESLYIDGDWHEGDDRNTSTVVDPTTEEIIAAVPSATDADVDKAAEAAATAQDDWEARPAVERGDFLREIATVIDDHSDELVNLLVEEQGKPIETARGELAGTVERAEYTAEWDRRIEGDIVPSDSRQESIHLRRQPIGVVGAIVPWNYPVGLFMRKVAPALVVGNTIVLKPSETTPITTLRMMELINEHVDLPDGVLNLVTGAGEVGGRLVTTPATDMITMTGSVATGKMIMRQAADDLTRVSLELGGKAPAIVWKDADIDEAVEDILTARVTNAGQVCTCAERVYVHSAVAETFREKYVDAADRLTVGDPRENPDMGPQVSQSALEKTKHAVQEAREEGSIALIGGEQPTGDEFDTGYWYEPTVLTDVDQGMEIVQEEIFGPVTPIVEIDSLEEVIKYANDSRYGLSAYVFSDDYRKIMQTVEELQFGEIYVNRSLGEALQAHHVGWNESGIGGEDGKYGVLKYTQLKTVYHNYE